MLLLKTAAFGAALYVLRLERFRRKDWQHVATDVAFAAVAFWGYIGVIEAAIGVAFTNSPLHAWSLGAAGAIGARDFLAKHNVIAFFAFALWTSYFTYWTHRLSHKIHALWEVHKVHHSATRMTGLSVFRVHPIEEVLISYVGPVLTILLLPELGSRSAVNYGFLLLVHNIAVHSEWKATWRWCSWLVTSPAAHQIHHSTNPKHFNANFGVPLCIWDRLHGTYVDPLKTEAPTAYGVDDVAPTSPRALLWDPAVRFVQRLLPQRAPRTRSAA